MASYDDTIFQIVREAEADLERRLSANILYFNSEIRMNIFPWFREIIEAIARDPAKLDAIAIVLTTPGGEVEAVEKLVEVTRHHFKFLYCIIPVAAMSAGTIFSLAADKIYMDYSSSLGPIDPQVPDREGRFLVPALGYLDKVNEIIEKSRLNTITAVEFEWAMMQDLAMLQLYDQARNLSVALLEKWLVQYMFNHPSNPGSPVTISEKQARASEIAKLLSNNVHWHSHGRMIGMQTLRSVCKLEIHDFGGDADLQNAVRRFNDTLSEYLSRDGITTFLYN